MHNFILPLIILAPLTCSKLGSGSSIAILSRDQGPGLGMVHRISTGAPFMRADSLIARETAWSIRA
jgi:hypothetical protein